MATFLQFIQFCQNIGVDKRLRKACFQRGPKFQLAAEQLENRQLLSGIGVDFPTFMSVDIQQPVACGVSGHALEILENHAGDGDHFHDLSCSCCACSGGSAHGLPLPTDQPGDSGPGYENAELNIPLSDTFRLHSNAGANHTIYLDFDGHTTTGTYWNNSFGASFETPAYSMDGNSNFNETELLTIQEIWARVTEDFLPFDVNVTTEAPPEADLINSGGGDTKWGVRVAIGGTYADWFGSSAGGVAYVGSFTWSQDAPTYVFSDTLYDDAKFVSEAVSHEAGHTLGLSHDGTSSVGYYTGHGSGSTGWAPIMGVGYYRDLTQWSKGEYDDANQTQDDLQIITTNNGFGYRTDDHGNDQASATALTDDGSGNVTVSGIIEQSTDLDFFSFETSGGLVQLQIDPADVGANLDILAQLIDSEGNVVATSNPTGDLTASFNVTLEAGTYYISIDGTSEGTLSTGYSDYGSLGEFNISGSIEGFGEQPVDPSYKFAVWGTNGQLRWVMSDGSNPTLDGSAPTIVNPIATHTGDFDGDGAEEVLILDGQGQWWIGNNYNETISFRVVSQWGAVNRIVETAVGDFNGDGIDDFAALYDTGKWWVGLSNGVDVVTRMWGGWSSALTSGQIFVADFNGDGRIDVASMTSTGVWAVGLANNGEFATQNWGQLGSPERIDSLLVGDFDGDGDQDILARYNTGAWWLATSLGGQFVNRYQTRWSGAERILDTQTGDFDGDGMQDIITFYDNGNWVIGRSTGTNIDAQLWGTWGKPEDVNQILIGDFDGDGKDDLSALYANGAWWLGTNSSSSFSAQKVAHWSSGVNVGTFLIGSFRSTAVDEQLNGILQPAAPALPDSEPSSTYSLVIESVFVPDFSFEASTGNETLKGSETEFSRTRWQSGSSVRSKGESGTNQDWAERLRSQMKSPEDSSEESAGFWNDADQDSLFDLLSLSLS